MNAPKEETLFPSWFPALWLLLLSVLSIYLRVHIADEYYYSPDEAMHTAIAGSTTLSDVLKYSIFETHPPLLYVFYHYWMMISQYPAFVRCFSLACGIVLIFVYYFIGKLLRDDLTGMGCAALVAFSYGSIIQSYVIRHYALFSVFIALAFYSYQRWRISRSNPALLAYGGFMLLGILTHFSGIFTIACFILYEGYEMLKQNEKLRNRLGWMTVNLVVIACMLFVNNLWQPTLEQSRLYFNPPSHLTLVLYAICSPLATATYIFPSYTAALVVVAFLLVPAFRCWGKDEQRYRLRDMLSMAWISLAFGMAVIATGIYPFLGTRRSLWAMPFILPAAGWILTDMLAWINGIIPSRAHATARYMGIALLLIAGGWSTYTPKERFADELEYSITIKKIKAVEPFLSSLTALDIIIAERDDAVILADIYPALGDGAFIYREKAALIPYLQTHILFNPFYRRIMQTSSLLDTLREAGEKHMLDHVQRVIFMKTRTTYLAMKRLMHCPGLSEKIFIPSEQEFKHAGQDMTFVIIPAHPFLDTVFLPGSEAYKCFVASKPHS